MPLRCVLLCFAVLFAAAAVASADGRGVQHQDGAQRTPAALDGFEPYPTSGDAGRRAAIERGLKWLSTRHDSRDGSIEVGDAEADQRAPLAITSLAALAWMAGGSTPTTGPYQENVTRAIEYLLASVHRSTDKHPGFIEDREDSVSQTHGHGFATLALAHAYTMSPRSSLGARIAPALAAAVARIETSQGAEGGWNYEAYRSLQHEGSVTVALVQALRAAKDAGLRVNPDVIARAVDYVERLQVMDRPDAQDAGASNRRLELGGFRYKLNDPSTSVALTAAGLATMQAAGIYEGPRIQEGYDYVWRKLLEREEEPLGNEADFPYYERFYLSQALWHHRDQRLYRRWAEPVMSQLVELQEPSGRWEDERFSSGRRITSRYGAAYATACNVLFLVVPDDALGMFHR